MKSFVEFLNDISSDNKTIRRIYVCSPLSAKSQAAITYNMVCAKDKCNMLNGAFRDYGIKAWAPHAWLPNILDDNIGAERELAVEFGMGLLKLSDAVYVFGSHLSSGMKNEITYAVNHGLDIVIDSADIREEVTEFIQDVEKKKETEDE